MSQVTFNIAVSLDGYSAGPDQSLDDPLGTNSDLLHDWFVKTNGDPRSSVTKEVDRYCSMPGQACGYKVGSLEINRLRDKAKAALGPKFDLRRYDDAVVLGGSVPMTLLETVIDGFIAKAKG